MKNKKAVASFELFLMIASLFAFSYLIYLSTPVSAAAVTSNPSFCCEKTNSGGYCINAEESECNGGYRSTSTSCETTSYCKLGTCYDSEEGLCMENTPQVVCEDSGGTWDAREASQVPQCQLGCCVIGDQAAFVPLVRCKRLSTLFGVDNDYRTDITSEVECIATANEADKGACVYEKDFERVCEFTTRGDCGAGNNIDTINGSDVELSKDRKFYEDYLCSAEELNTACARQVSTKCHEGEVYWVDSCGNLENVYSENKEVSWNNGRVAKPEEVCRANDGSNKGCGNCDYMLGTQCAEWDGLLGGPKGSDYYCQKTECTDRDGNKRINGESWCVYDGTIGEGADAAGSRYYREVCVNGEVRVDACADFRNEICIEDSIDTSAGAFGTAGCIVNRWHDCTSQEEQDDCENIDKRDCMWLAPVTGMNLGAGQGVSGKTTGFSNPSANSGFNNPTATGTTGNVIAPITGMGIFGGGDDDEEQEETVTNRPDGICVPNYPPGLDFWSDEESNGICAQASAKCVVVFEKGLLGGKECVENCECLEEDWALQANNVCTALGDCGAYVNFEDEFTDDGYEWKVDEEDREFTPNAQNKIASGFHAMVVAAITGSAIATGKDAETVNNLLKFHAKEGNVAAATATATTPTSIAGVKSSWLANKFLSSGGVNTATTTISGTSITASTSTFSASGILVSGLQWAGVAYGIGYLVGSMMGMSNDNTKALSTALAAGAFAYKSLSMHFANQLAGSGVAIANPSAATGLFATQSTGIGASGAATTVKSGFMGMGAMGWGLVIGAVIFVAMYKKVELQVVTFECKPWQSPTGVDEATCEICNDADLPCSEYRCKALGQSCEIVNKGTAEEKCVNVNPRDVDPPVIRPNKNELTVGYEYTNVKNSPPGPGFKIVNTGSERCIPAFAPLQFGIVTNEPAQCKIDYTHTDKFEEMSSFVGGSNMFRYNHTEYFKLPNTKDLENASFELANGNEFTFFIRCQDSNGNTNEAEYAVNFCIDDGPDTTAPIIEATSVFNGGCVAEESDSVIVDFYTNEPADCRWSPFDQSYDNMQNEMSCTSEVYQLNAMQLYTCRSNLTGVSRDLTDYYIRCKDQPGEDEGNRNENRESLKFNLRGSTALKINKMLPNGTIFGGVSPSPVELYVETLFGCEKGQSICYYSETGDQDDFIMFYDTDNSDGISTQRLDLSGGDKKYFIKCIDAGGNLVEDTLEFTLDIDTNAPDVARVYEQDSMLKVVTVRDSECAYSLDNCDFTFEEGTEMPYANSTTHVVEWNHEETFYIKCRDEFKNENADCSVVVRPSKNFL